MVRHHDWLLKISEDTFYGVGETANNKETPEAGGEAAKNKSGPVSHRVVRRETVAPPLSSLGARHAQLPSALTTQTVCHWLFLLPRTFHS